jgi:hypothetical protein
MNTKRKILTVVALALFSVIIALHYIDLGDMEMTFPQQEYSWSGGRPTVGHRPSGTYWGWSRGEPTITHLPVPLLVLGVFYGGFFALLGTKQKETK